MSDHPNSIQNLLDHVLEKKRRAEIPAGTRFGKLVVLHKIDCEGDAKYWVRCDCGTERTVVGYYLKGGRTKACASPGCRWTHTKHGLCLKGKKHPRYGAWKTMRQRCNNPSYPGYRNYGGRGIKICERWNDFRLFAADIGDRPSSRHTIGRIDNNGDYCPSNCRWETWEQQARNKRSSRILTLNGRSMTIAGWAEELGVSQDFIHNRKFRRWSDERTLTEPAHKRSQSGR